MFPTWKEAQTFPRRSFHMQTVANRPTAGDRNLEGRVDDLSELVCWESEEPRLFSKETLDECAGTMKQIITNGVG